MLLESHFQQRLLRQLERQEQRIMIMSPIDSPIALPVMSRSKRVNLPLRNMPGVMPIYGKAKFTQKA
jgi:hypothetical protein